MHLTLSNGWEVLRSAVSRQEMTTLGKSYVLSWDSLFQSHGGCIGRLVVCGYTLEFYRPTVGAHAAS